jgi:hypothetical protein
VRRQVTHLPLHESFLFHAHCVSATLSWRLKWIPPQKWQVLWDFRFSWHDYKDYCGLEFMLSTLVDIYQYFGGACCIQLWGTRISHTKHWFALSTSFCPPFCITDCFLPCALFLCHCKHSFPDLVNKFWTLQFHFRFCSIFLILLKICHIHCLDSDFVPLWVCMSWHAVSLIYTL